MHGRMNYLKKSLILRWHPVIFPCFCDNHKAVPYGNKKKNGRSFAKFNLPHLINACNREATLVAADGAFSHSGEIHGLKCVLPELMGSCYTRYGSMQQAFEHCIHCMHELPCITKSPRSHFEETEVWRAHTVDTGMRNYEQKSSFRILLVVFDRLWCANGPALALPMLISVPSFAADEKMDH